MKNEYDVIEEQLLHKMGYNVFTIPKLTLWERKRLVYGYSNFDKILAGIEQEQTSAKAEELIKQRKEKHGRRGSKDNRQR